MNGVASLGVGYNGKEISISGYNRFNFDAKKIKFSENKYKVLFGFRPDIYLDKINKKFYVNELYLFVNSKKIGILKIDESILNSFGGGIHLPSSFRLDIYREER